MAKITTIANNMKGVLKNFLLSYSEYCQIQLNILMDERHMSNITKLGKKKKKNTSVS
jgi:hypothetical protein